MIAITESAPVAAAYSPSASPHDKPLSSSVHATDADNDTLTYAAVTQPAHGTLTFTSNGSFTYTPTAHYSGSDSFTYQANDGLLNSNVATVLIGVTQSAPVATNDSYTIAHGVTLTTTAGGFGNTAPVLYNDTDADRDTMTAAVVTQPTHGTLTFSSNGTFTYTPTAGFVGTDSFTYQASDDLLTSNTATAIIVVTESAPVDRSLLANLNHDTPLSTYAQGTDPDNDTLTYSVVAQPTHGTVTLNANGYFTYTPTAHYSGTDSFTYQTSDGVLNSATLRRSSSQSPKPPPSPPVRRSASGTTGR